MIRTVVLLTVIISLSVGAAGPDTLFLSPGPTPPDVAWFGTYLRTSNHGPFMVGECPEGDWCVAIQWYAGQGAGHWEVWRLEPMPVELTQCEKQASGGYAECSDLSLPEDLWGTLVDYLLRYVEGGESIDVQYSSVYVPTIAPLHLVSRITAYDRETNQILVSLAIRGREAASEVFAVGLQDRFGTYEDPTLGGLPNNFYVRQPFTGAFEFVCQDPPCSESGRFDLAVDAAPFRAPMPSDFCMVDFWETDGVEHWWVVEAVPHCPPYQTWLPVILR